jgi:hypothetical protein
MLKKSASAKTVSREASLVKRISKRPSFVKREAYLVGDKSVWLMAYSWQQRRPLSIPDHTLLAIRHMLFFGRETNDGRRGRPF